MGTCWSGDPARGAGHELVAVKRHTASWPSAPTALTYVGDHEFSTWDLRRDASSTIERVAALLVRLRPPAVRRLRTRGKTDLPKEAMGRRSLQLPFVVDLLFSKLASGKVDYPQQVVQMKPDRKRSVHPCPRETTDRGFFLTRVGSLLGVGKATPQPISRWYGPKNIGHFLTTYRDSRTSRFRLRHLFFSDHVS
ncbi:hypothetical protein EYF80_040610 [Liparis tanakae]|uniref:Uncharacterized protein n=1 Tax=Liparis tanakae TaxID=230148 RepID=A0A4Z2G7I1_9TELE|nr:hypothetical protein EYF80_040610 [Liparis tanakae]